MGYFGAVKKEQDIQAAAGENIPALRCVVVEENVARLASSGNPAHADRIAGISLNAASIGGTLKIRTSGELEGGSWSWNSDALLYCGLDGVLTGEPSQAGFAQIVGVALAHDRVLVSPRRAVLINQ